MEKRAVVGVAGCTCGRPHCGRPSRRVDGGRELAHVLAGRCCTRTRSNRAEPTGLDGLGLAGVSSQADLEGPPGGVSRPAWVRSVRHVAPRRSPRRWRMRGSAGYVGWGSWRRYAALMNRVPAAAVVDAVAAVDAAGAAAAGVVAVSAASVVVVAAVDAAARVAAAAIVIAAAAVDAAVVAAAVTALGMMKSVSGGTSTRTCARRWRCRDR